MIAIAFLLAAAAEGGDAAEIRRLRLRSNAAIAAHRADEVRRFFTDDYTALPGSSGRPLSAGQTQERLAAGFADPSFVTFVRKPARIVSPPRESAPPRRGGGSACGARATGKCA